MQASHVADVFGGRKVLGRTISSLNDFVPMLRDGLPFASLESLMTLFGIPRSDIARFLGIPARTMNRRRKEQRLQPWESDRVFRLARILVHAMAVFQDREKVGRWIQSPNMALGGTTPFELMDTDAGTEQVDAVLTRIEHGVYS